VAHATSIAPRRFSFVLVPDLPTVEEQGIPEQRSFVKKGIFDGAGHADRLARP
jgi:tripartite-type tricarboxylate transporter receptor subunit TctC